MKDCYEFRFFTDITVTRDDVIYGPDPTYAL